MSSTQQKNNSIKNSKLNLEAHMCNPSCQGAWGRRIKVHGQSRQLWNLVCLSHTRPWIQSLVLARNQTENLGRKESALKMWMSALLLNCNVTCPNVSHQESAANNTLKMEPSMTWKEATASQLQDTVSNIFYVFFQAVLSTVSSVSPIPAQVKHVLSLN